MSARRILLLLVALVSTTALAACGSDTTGSATTPAASADFASVREQARGQTVRWWLYGGDDKVNSYIDDTVAPAAKQLGVTIKRVPVTDTADAVQRVVSERRAGKTSGGAVDLIWINGENFAAGKKADLWLKGDWARRLPNARRFVDEQDPSINTDFQVPVDGQESPWQRAAFVYAYDQKRTPAPPKTFDDLLAYAQAHPGRVTYPAPPDFTGSAFVRQVVQAKGEDAAFAYLKQLKPFLYRNGNTYPKSEAELTTLFGNGKLDFAMSYDSSFLDSAVSKGQVPKTARPFVLDSGALQNVSYVTIPADAAHPAAAQVVADLLLSPAQQAAKAAPTSIGNPTVLDLSKVGAFGQKFAAVTDSPFLLKDFGKPLQELAASKVAPLEKRWMREVLR